MGETRKIAAILVADIVGYSRLAGADEDRILARLRALRSDLIDPTITLPASSSLTIGHRISLLASISIIGPRPLPPNRANAPAGSANWRRKIACSCAARTRRPLRLLDELIVAPSGERRRRPAVRPGHGPSAQSPALAGRDFDVACACLARRSRDPPRRMRDLPACRPDRRAAMHQGAQLRHHPPRGHRAAQPRKICHLADRGNHPNGDVRANSSAVPGCVSLGA